MILALGIIGIIWILYKSGALTNVEADLTQTSIGAGGTVGNPTGYTGIGSSPQGYTGLGGQGTTASSSQNPFSAIPINGVSGNGTNYTAITMGGGSQGITGISVGGQLYNASDPVGPTGQTVSQLLTSGGMSLSDLADYLAMSAPTAGA